MNREDDANARNPTSSAYDNQDDSHQEDMSQEERDLLGLDNREDDDLI